MSNMQMMSRNAVRKIVIGYINGEIGRNEEGQHVYPTGRSITAYDEDRDHVFLWLKIDQDRQQFEQRYRHQHGVSDNTALPTGSIDYLSRQIGFYPHPKNSRLGIVINHVPYDITDEQFDRVVAKRCETLGGKFSEPVTLNFRINNNEEK